MRKLLLTLFAIFLTVNAFALTLTYKRLGSSTVLSASNSTIYTVPASTTAEVKVCWITNTTTSDVTIELWHVASGGSASDTNKLMDGVTIPASDFKKIQADWQMATGDTIQAKGSTNIATSIQLYGVESAS